MNTNPLCDKGGAVVLLMTPKPRPNIVERALTAFLGGVVHEFRLAHVDDPAAVRYGIQPLQLTEPFPT